MKEHRVGIIMNGVTGRMATNQHLERSLLAIRAQGGLSIRDGETIIPDLVFLGRNEHKLRALSEAYGGFPWSTDMDALLSDPRYTIYFDAQITNRRAECLKKAIAAGKHIYCEKPTAENLADAVEVYRLAEKAGVKTGVVQDKLWLPGLLKLKYLIDTGFFGRILSVRGEFGYWVFDGEHDPLQRPSWNYRKKDGGGIILDMLPHWRYLIDNLFGKVVSFVCVGVTNLSKRWDENGKPYEADCEDTAYTTFLLERDIVCRFNSSWCTRVNREELLELHVDGTAGSAVAGLRNCKVQPAAATPRAIWNPDIDSPMQYRAGWIPVPDHQPVYDNAFKIEWELFLRHVVLDEPFPWNLKEGAKGVQLAELGYESWKKRCWVDVPEL